MFNSNDFPQSPGSHSHQGEFLVNSLRCIPIILLQDHFSRVIESKHGDSWEFSRFPTKLVGHFPMNEGCGIACCLVHCSEGDLLELFEQVSINRLHLPQSAGLIDRVREMNRFIVNITQMFTGRFVHGLQKMDKGIQRFVAC